MGATSEIGGRRFVWGARTYVMGVINTSPDSFSGDGVASVEEAVRQAVGFAQEGADLLDVGGQSTRPAAGAKSEAGFEEISAEEEIRRTAPAIERIRRELPEMPISIDTYKAEVARAGIDAGAHMLNDIYGFRRDASLAGIAAAAGVAVCLMHNQRGREPGDVIACVASGLRESVAIAERAGIGREKIVLDPGFGFGWKADENIEMLRRLAELRELGSPLLVGTSRKSSIGAVLGGAPVQGRLFGTAATVALSIANGADIVRVHDVREMVQVARVSDAIVRGWSEGS